MECEPQNQTSNAHPSPPGAALLDAPRNGSQPLVGCPMPRPHEEGTPSPPPVSEWDFNELAAVLAIALGMLVLVIVGIGFVYLLKRLRKRAPPFNGDSDCDEYCEGFLIGTIQQDGRICHDGVIHFEDRVGRSAPGGGGGGGDVPRYVLHRPPMRPRGGSARRALHAGRERGDEELPASNPGSFASEAAPEANGGAGDASPMDASPGPSQYFAPTFVNPADDSPSPAAKSDGSTRFVRIPLGSMRTIPSMSDMHSRAQSRGRVRGPFSVSTLASERALSFTTKTMQPDRRPVGQRSVAAAQVARTAAEIEEAAHLRAPQPEPAAAAAAAAASTPPDGPTAETQAVPTMNGTTQPPAAAASGKQSTENVDVLARQLEQQHQQHHQQQAPLAAVPAQGTIPSSAWGDSDDSGDFEDRSTLSGGSRSATPA